MRKTAIITTTALMVTAFTPAYAQDLSWQHSKPLTAQDLKALTDARVGIVKAALQLTPDQEKYWPAIEDAIRSRAKNRQGRLARIAEVASRDPVEVLKERNPVEFLNRRADALAERSGDLRKLAGAWDPLYKTLTPEQKQRMAMLALSVLQNVRAALEARQTQDSYYDYDYDEGE